MPEPAGVAPARPSRPRAPGTVILGIGLSSRASAADVRRCAEAALTAAGLAWSDVERVATLDSLAPDDRIGALGRPVVGYGPDRLAGVDGVQRSGRVEAAVGTPSVAEAAALLAAGPDGVLVAAKRASDGVTTAVARR